MNNEVKADSAKTIKLLYIISTIIVIVGSFLPYISSLGVSTNYVINEGELQDGIFVIGALILACIFLLCNKKIPVIIFQLIAIAVFAYDYIDVQNTLNEMSYFANLIEFGAGFYIALVGLIISVIPAILLIKHKKNN